MTTKNLPSNPEEFESIDAVAVSPLVDLAQDIKKYLDTYNELNIADRLRIEKEIKKLQEREEPSWLLNLLVNIFRK